jgi:hypothetical protein
MSEETQVIQEPKLTEPVEDTQAQQKQASNPPEETQEQINWKRFRQEREKERKEKLESDRRATEKEAEASALKAAMESLLNKPQQQYVQQEEEETEDQRIDKKVQAALKAERDRNEVERKQREVQELPSRIKSEHPDFDHVCSQENVDYLAYHHPELYRRFKNAPESLETYSDLYKAMKRYVPNADSRRDAAKIEKNLSKPQSMSQGGVTQTGDHAPHKLDDQRRADNWQRMQRTLKGIK